MLSRARNWPQRLGADAWIKIGVMNGVVASLPTLTPASTGLHKIISSIVWTMSSRGESCKRGRKICVASEIGCASGRFYPAYPLRSNEPMSRDGGHGRMPGYFQMLFRL